MDKAKWPTMSTLLSVALKNIKLFIILSMVEVYIKEKFGYIYSRYLQQIQH